MSTIRRLLAISVCTSVLAACGGGGGGGGSTSVPNNPPPPPPPPPPQSSARIEGDGPFLVVDQFGYRTDMEKIAVIRNPVTGFDADDLIDPADEYLVVDEATGTTVLTVLPTEWNGGASHSGSGDEAWWLDFSAVTAPGTYTIRDSEDLVVSASFEIGDDVYDDVLKAALKVMFYQRAGFAKDAAYVGTGWADGASHVGPGQDTEARLYSAPGDASTERDLHGGWYDAGDYNKYTNWTADYVISLLTSYMERPAIWTDDVGIPESGNGIPDILDEVKWGLDWLIRMQNADGSVLSIVGLDGASPPSAATGPSTYGPESSSATLTTAAAFALASEVYGGLGDATLSTYAADLEQRAEEAWDWAVANPDVTFRNNDSAMGSQGLGAGQQEVSDEARAEKKLSAAIYLAHATGESGYHDYVTANYSASKMVGSFYINGFEANSQRDLLFYTSVSGANPTVATTILDRYETAMAGSNELWQAVDGEIDPYRAYLGAYTWGSNAVKSRTGMLYVQQASYGLGTQSVDAAMAAGAGYIHYLHGVNPLGLVYLSNMAAEGAKKSVDTFYHTWFSDGSALWDSVSGSTYGPAPGFLVGGANPSYDWDSCCPTGCGSAANNNQCGITPPAPPAGQPTQKSYLQFNDGWPLNSWQVTENSNGYQTDYIRLLSKYVD
ncbi:glycoside hydrolase family 9 protein [Parvularcula sp. LCG005]|uniref:glycoside hydrolase family 9 protein n=1 Tax=Parvularcula sp. LCG005 TaxID=3078805 RepID=UPI002943CBC3|nr:glycoside hydrolase family 9 protein [Parvularcula sp. LCG005]WOI53551.1 glycoside hydrolase family 9 protein [Parvularcula sp. LCG005]